MALQCFNIGEACKNPLYICWRNSIGGWDYWLFDISQTVFVNSTLTSDFESYTSDIESSRGIQRALKKNALESVVVQSDNLTQQEANGLKEIFYSPTVYVLREWNPPDAPIWTEVIVPDGQNQIYETQRTYNQLQIELQFPKKFTLSN